MRTPANEWYSEPIQPTFLHQLKLKAVHYTGRTAHQRVEVIETEPLGRTLVLDGKTQSAEADEFIYHEALVHPALLAHPDPREVLILGGGEGATLREVLAHRTVRRAVMVDLDAELVALCKEHLPSWHRGAFDDPRAQLVFADARKYLQGCHDTFDVIILDVTDPAEGGPSQRLFTLGFYQMARERLSADGLLVTQAGPTSHGMAGLFTAIANTVQEGFGRVFPYQVNLLSYGSDWGFTLASRHPDLAALAPQEIDQRIATRVSSELRFYDGTTHLGMFALPKWLRQELAAEQCILTEESQVPTL